MVVRVLRVVLAAAFSLLYIALYPVLAGDFVIHHYPHWPRPIAASYVIGGVLLQAWFCCRRSAPDPGYALLAQIVAGVVHVVAIAFVPGDIILT